MSVERIGYVKIVGLDPRSKVLSVVVYLGNSSGS